MSRNIKCYSELITLPTLVERYEYLRIGGNVGEDTFGYDRWINQRFYRSEEYRRLRRKIVVKQNGWDLGVEGYPLPEIFILHHMNPITVEDIINGSEFAWDPKYLVCVSPATHRAIHYQESKNQLPLIAKRSPNDTSPWRNNK